MAHSLWSMHAHLSRLVSTASIRVNFYDTGSRTRFVLEPSLDDIVTCVICVDVANIAVLGSPRAHLLSTVWYPVGSYLHLTSSWSPRDQIRLIAEVACAIQHQHASGTVHGDIYPGNIFINKNSQVILARAGLYTAVQRISPRVPLQASTRYKAPEELKMDAVYTPTSAMDVYAWAVSVVAIFSGHDPFPTYGHARVTSEILCRGHMSLSKPINMGEDLWNILQDCWKVSTTERVTMQQVIAALEPLASTASTLPL